MKEQVHGPSFVDKSELSFFITGLFLKFKYW